MIDRVIQIILGIGAIVVGFLYKNNQALKRDKVHLQREALYKDKQIKMKDEVINVTKNHKDKSISGNIKRMREGEL